MWRPLLLLALGVAAMGLALACQRGPVPPPQYTGGPRLALGQRAVDFGDVPPGKPLEATIEMRNVGDQPLKLQEAFARVLEGCCPPKPELETTELRPGARVTLRVPITMSESMTGPHVFEVVLRSNDPVEPETRLTIRANYVSR